ncbi:terminase TerL endonuclease subunit [Thomasclavelia ramosa]|uniref:terminase TerL endonuclease subunit n=1 Tax=Thomasclavelia ramosa TaxID=1547 RepID=UPI001D062C90|nr:terminase TerL endonuclease subunit [Thomasclavelia ramosa]MCB6698462.1 terminase large subunit [Thomasclavelia ramosa]MCQ5114305.1 terminase large subunit [Thomasclavelia ramosa]
MNCRLPFFVERYFDFMDDHCEKFCEDQWALRKLIIRTFENDDIYVDIKQAESYFGLSKYFDFERMFEWQEFVLGLHLCTYWRNSGLPRWPDALILMGRGNGKDGTISLESLSLISPYNTVNEYDVDICANNEMQAKRPAKDIVTAFERNRKKMLRFFHWTQESIRGLKRNSFIHGHTNNAKGKDGLRSGCVIFNEYHAYENYDNINVFTTGLGKKKHPRRTIYTTNGNVVDGPLDELIKKCEGILYEDKPDDGLLPFICRLNSKNDVHDERNWYMANPSLFYMPNLLNEIRKEYREWKENPARLPDFMTKRMNIRESNSELAVTSWENLKKTNKRYDGKLRGRECIAGIDFSKTTDWASVNLHFKEEDKRIDLNKAWICMNNPEISRLKCPYMDWAEKGHVELIDDVEIRPKIIAEYIREKGRIYRIKAICLDDYRYEILRDCLEEIEYSIERKNIILIRPRHIMKIYPIIDRCFANQYFYWGEQPHLRWATNNTKLVRTKKSTLAIDGELDMGNFLFGKIEPKSRKTDPFMALVHSMCGEDKLSPVYKVSRARKRVRVITF